MRKDYYVYFHKDYLDQIFYVWKGTGRRAWSKDRHPVWVRYVNESLNGIYNIEIYIDGLTESEAGELESSLIDKYGKQIVNWINFGRDFDYQAIDKYNQLRKENQHFIAETRSYEKNDLHLAISRYKQALKAMREYEAITRERGLVAELNVGPNWGDPNILDRLTICLIKAGMFQEAIEEVNKYFNEFPSASKLEVGNAFLSE